MEKAPVLITTLANTPAVILALMIALAAFGLAAFTIWVVHEHTKPKGKR